MMGAAILSAPEWELEEDEAKKVAKAITQVSELYPDVPMLSAKAQAWTGLAVTLGGIYGPRLVVTMRKAGNKKPVIMRPPVPINGVTDIPKTQAQPAPDPFGFQTIIDHGTHTMGGPVMEGVM